MKKLIFLFLISILSAQAQDKTNALLWKISGNHASKPSYIFGTMHLICSSDFILSDSLKAAFGKSEQVVMELDMDDPTMMASMQEVMFMKNGKNLKNLLNDPDYKTINQYFKDSVGMGL